MLYGPTTMNTGKHIPLIAIFVLGSGTLYSALLSAACYSGHPSPEDELKGSKLVIAGRVISHKDVMSENAADIVGKTVYRMELRRIYKGRARTTISIASENTSSRFPMDYGVEYLLFVSEYNGEYFIDPCGNSGRFDDSGPLIKRLNLHP